MSKAFTKEDSSGEEPVIPRPRPPSGDKRYITPEGYRALQEELARLLGPEAGEEGQEAWGAADRKRERERRAHFLSETLEEVRVVAPEPSQEGRVFFGAWVTLEDEEGAEVTYRIVGPDEADVKAGRLSVESPLARALLGKEVGEAVPVERPRGAVEYTLTRVAYTPASH
ncbi:GreA/GreB family elongation factor [Stigmatella aurantiaca]|uniref:GreA/GreB family elongation factor n=1 Tax=Stigmatella aurantiaca (strain DW4/3-1) TaxID=378806 RepID=Q08RM9_STIAD|nr:GreA/GreB family elongation factor [Stigmatella aurantiaca]ADO68784.1 Transcription elongation factor, GreA/GreB family [Stigmatella aurantiaca DW4/3-1]EAU63127.1 GreA/GreB family elongation factor [Stigmatella aurantiaca DW4/3-1]